MIIFKKLELMFFMLIKERHLKTVALLIVYFFSKPSFSTELLVMRHVKRILNYFPNTFLKVFARIVRSERA